MSAHGFTIARKFTAENGKTYAPGAEATFVSDGLNVRRYVSLNFLTLDSAPPTSSVFSFRSAQSVGAPAVGDTLYGPGSGYVGSPLVDATAAFAVLAIAGAVGVRLRGKITGAGGTLSLTYSRPAALRGDDPNADGASYDPTITGPADDVTVTADTEFLVDITPGGESDLLLTLTPDGAGSVVFLDAMFQ